MNPEQQKQRHSVALGFTAQIAELEQTVEKAYEAEAKTREEHDSAVMAYIDKRINEERTHRLKLADEQRFYVDTQDQENARQLQAHRMRNVMMDGCSVWRRLYWLVTGVWL